MAVAVTATLHSCWFPVYLSETKGFHDCAMWILKINYADKTGIVDEWLFLLWNLSDPQKGLNSIQGMVLSKNCSLCSNRGTTFFLKKINWADMARIFFSNNEINFYSIKNFTVHKLRKGLCMNVWWWWYIFKAPPLKLRIEKSQAIKSKATPRARDKNIKNIARKCLD